MSLSFLSPWQSLEPRLFKPLGGGGGVDGGLLALITYNSMITQCPNSMKIVPVW